MEISMYILAQDVRFFNNIRKKRRPAKNPPMGDGKKRCFSSISTIDF